MKLGNVKIPKKDIDVWMILCQRFWHLKIQLTCNRKELALVAQAIVIHQNPIPLRSRMNVPPIQNNRPTINGLTGPMKFTDQRCVLIALTSQHSIDLELADQVVSTKNINDA